MFFKPHLSATAQCSGRADFMTDSFYMNGAIPPVGAVPTNKAYAKDVRSRMGVFAVSDGFGHGEEAVNAAHKSLSILKKYHEKLESVNLETVGNIVETYAEEANQYMNSLGGGIGASMSMLVINHGVATAINTGSARVYSYKCGRLNRLSIDDTEAQRLLNIGAIRQEEAKDHPSRRTLTSALGMLAPQTNGNRMHMSSPMPVENGDIFLLCSNGLTDYISDDRIAYILSLHMSNERLSQRLISEAIARGADDTVSVMVVRSGKNKKPALINKRVVKGGFIVILLAILAAYLISTPWKERGQEPGTTIVEPIEPTQTPVSILNTPPIDEDNFELRQ